MGRRRVVLMVRRRAGMRGGGMPGFRAAGMRGGGMPGLGACQDVGPSCRADGVVCLADGAEACRADGTEACRNEGWRHAGI